MGIRLLTRYMFDSMMPNSNLSFLQRFLFEAQLEALVSLSNNVIHGA